MRKQMVKSFVLGLVLGLSCWWLSSIYSVAGPTATAVRFVPSGTDENGVLVGQLVAKVGGEWIAVAAVAPASSPFLPVR